MTVSLLPVVLVAGCFLTESPQSVRTEPMRTEEIRVEGAAGSVAAAAEMAVDLQLPSGRAEAGYLVGVYEPKTRAFWWLYEMRNPSAASGPLERLKERTPFHLVDSKLVAFVTNGRFLGIRESTERANSLQDGMDAARASLNASLPQLEAGTKEWYVAVDLASLGRDFFVLAGSAATLNPPAIKSVSRSGAQWTVTLEGPNRDTAVVVLDDKYSVSSIRRQP